MYVISGQIKEWEFLIILLVTTFGESLKNKKNCLVSYRQDLLHIYTIVILIGSYHGCHGYRCSGSLTQLPNDCGWLVSWEGRESQFIFGSYIKQGSKTRL